jgi:AGZA family xanthine/uracil permease-like MFS transporter
MLIYLRRFFCFEERRADFHTEMIAGTTTFLAMAYIIFVNPSILSAAGMDKSAQITSTCLAAAAATLLAGLLAKAPVAMAPGMGLNAFFAYTLVLQDKIRWETALGIVFLSGAFFYLLTVFGIRRKLVEAIPASLIAAMSVGIGLFITLIGLVNLGLIVKSEETLIAAGRIDSRVLIGLAGFLVMLLLEMKNVKGGMILGILVSTLLAILFGKVPAPGAVISFRLDFSSLIFKMDLLGALQWSFFGAIFTLMFMDMFDSIGSLVACCNQARLTDSKGNIRDLDKLLTVNAGATMLGALLGTSTTTTYVESVVGIKQGGRTGFSSLVTAFWFLLGLVFTPLIAVVPPYATAPALILVGFFMIREVRRIDFSDLEEGFPSFLIMTMIALSYSISTGLAFGFVSFIFLKLIKRKWREIKPVMWLIGLFSVFYFML